MQVQGQAPRKGSIGKAKEAKAVVEIKRQEQDKTRTRSGSTSEYIQAKKKPTTMQKTHLEDP